MAALVALKKGKSKTWRGAYARLNAFDKCEQLDKPGGLQPYRENVSRQFQFTSDACESYRRTGIDTGSVIEVLRNQHQNIVQQQNLIAGQGAPSSCRSGSDAD